MTTLLTLKQARKKLADELIGVEDVMKRIEIIEAQAHPEVYESWLNDPYPGRLD